VKVRDILDRLHADGWRLKAQQGSHRQFVHAEKPGKVTVNGKPGDEITGDLLRYLFRQAQWDWHTRR
jgi:predicted RNA binding protein YcfA (HicA-like mRNA interferase family)